MKVLVTGAAGFLGYAVAALLVEQGQSSLPEIISAAWTALNSD